MSGHHQLATGISPELPGWLIRGASLMSQKPPSRQGPLPVCPACPQEYQVLRAGTMMALFLCGSWLPAGVGAEILTGVDGNALV